jgi:hypothetical protein
VLLVVVGRSLAEDDLLGKPGRRPELVDSERRVGVRDLGITVSQRYQPGVCLTPIGCSTGPRE